MAVVVVVMALSLSLLSSRLLFCGSAGDQITKVSFSVFAKMLTIQSTGASGSKSNQHRVASSQKRKRWKWGWRNDGSGGDGNNRSCLQGNERKKKWVWNEKVKMLSCWAQQKDVDNKSEFVWTCGQLQGVEAVSYDDNDDDEKSWKLRFCICEWVAKRWLKGLHLAPLSSSREYLLTLTTRKEVSQLKNKTTNPTKRKLMLNRRKSCRPLKGAQENHNKRVVCVCVCAVPVCVCVYVRLLCLALPFWWVPRWILLLLYSSGGSSSERV